MSFLLPKLLQGIVDANSIEAIEVAGVQSDSRKIKQGEAFFALPGTSVHGDTFCAQAIENGAIAIISDRDIVPKPDVSFIIVDDVRKAYAQAASKSSGDQPQNLVAVTGTSGKTSVVSFVQQIWNACGIKGASIGTLGVCAGDKNATGGALTTPDALSLHKSLAALKAGGVDHVALEASSHGLDQRRLDGIRFNVVGFTNLSRDHLDYHANEDEYREAKLRLFRDLLADGGYAVVNCDDPEHMPFMFAALDKGATLLTAGEEGAFFEITKVEPEGFAQRVTGRMVGEPADFLLPLVGRFQVDNAVMAISIATQSGADPEKALEALNHLEGAKGRLEHVGNHNGGAIFIDYAHKPGALEAALIGLRPFAKKRLIVVFGCGGDRDQGKRALMGEIASRLADKVIITDDNPRTEKASEIRKDILVSAKAAIEIAGREEAIKQAIADLNEGDLLLIAGKGHENYQIIGTEKIPFSDHDVVKDIIAK